MLQRDEISALRIRTGQAGDPTTDLDWFVRMTLGHSRNPWLVLLSDHRRCVAAMLLAERRILGFPSGYVKAEGMDEGFLICYPEKRSEYLSLMLTGLFSRNSALIAHVTQLANSGTAYSGPAENAGLKVEWKQGIFHNRVKLLETFDKTLAQYGAHTRRNIRYYLRKARAEGSRFIGRLTSEESFEAVMELQGYATHRVNVESVLGREAAMQAVPGSFALGVKGADGSWQSYLTGWRRARQTFVYWQMNRVIDKSSSMGTAMRAFLMEVEIARGASEIIFVGGSSAVFKRCCEVDQSVHLIVRRKGLRGWALSRLLERTVVAGHPLRVE